MKEPKHNKELIDKMRDSIEGMNNALNGIRELVFDPSVTHQGKVKALQRFFIEHGGK